MQLAKSLKKNIQPKSGVISKAYTSTKQLITNLITIKKNYHVIEKYKYLESDLIGKGYSSKVYKGSDLDNDEIKYAIKVMDISKIKGFLLQLLKTQIKIHLKLNHQNIVKCYDVIQTPTTFYLVLQYCSGGDLSQLLNQKKKISEGQALKIMHQVVQGYKYLIRQKILHRDLKPSNIIKNGRKWKIADFGFATKNDQPDDINVGTPIYMPPQSLKNSIYSHKSDFFSLGVMMHQIVYGKVPWYSKSEAILQKKMNEQKLDLQKNKTVLNVRIKNFINKCCQIQLEQRISEQQFLAFQLWPQKKKFEIDFKLQKAVSSRKKTKTKSKSKSKIDSMHKSFGLNLTAVKFRQKAKTTRDSLSQYNSKTIPFAQTIQQGQQFLKENKEILNQQIKFCKHLYYMIKNMKHFNLKSQTKDILTIVLFKHIIFLMKKMSNDKFNYFQFKKWNYFKKVPFYQVMRKQISLNLDLTQKQYLKYLKHKDIKVIRIVNKKFPQLSHQAEFNKKFYKNLSHFLKNLIYQFSQINAQIVNFGYSSKIKQVKEKVFGSPIKKQKQSKIKDNKISKQKLTHLKSLGSILSNKSADKAQKNHIQQKQLTMFQIGNNLNSLTLKDTDSFTQVLHSQFKIGQKDLLFAKSQAKLKIVDSKKYNGDDQIQPFTQPLLKIPKATIQSLSSLYHYYAVAENKASSDNHGSFSMVYFGYQVIQQSNICLLRDYQDTKLEANDYTKVKNLTKFL